MRRAHLTSLGIAVVLLTACGASQSPGERASAGKPEAAATASGTEERASPEVGAAVEQGAMQPQGAMLSVYVQGPSPSAGTASGMRVYEAEMVVVNEGDRPADVAQAHARFEAWRGDRRIECGSADLEGPVTIGPGEAQVYRASAACDIEAGVQSGDRPEVRAYLDFGADSGDLHREVHHVRVRDLE